MLKTVEKMLAVPNYLQRVSGWSYNSPLWHPRRLGCDCLSNSCRPVNLNPSSEGDPKHPLCGHQQSFNETSNILCNRLLSSIKQNVSIELCWKFLVRRSNKIVGLDLASFSEKVESHWCRLWKWVVTAHPCRSSTPTANGHGLTLPTQTQTSEQEYSDLTTS